MTANAKENDVESLEEVGEVVITVNKTQAVVCRLCCQIWSQINTNTYG
ncbi:hypothetical protein [Nostoc sp. TCL26-01]|nr:hypothetical protein [Nostoc sp. TCL26-01]